MCIGVTTAERLPTYFINLPKTVAGVGARKGHRVQSKTDTMTYRPELIFGLVGLAGVGLEDLSKKLREHLQTFGYKPIDIRLSELLEKCTGYVKQPTTKPVEHTRITHLQKMGDQFRLDMGDGAALALAGIAAIRKARTTESGNPDNPAIACAYILHQLKHPKEVELLRLVYGSTFVVLAAHDAKENRIDNLVKRIAEKENNPGKKNEYRRHAEEIILTDEKEDNDLGQNTRDAYPLADFFANLNPKSNAPGVQRFVDLLFGHPFHTPLAEEYAMYQAMAVSLGSSDEGRQVGAIIGSLSKDESATKDVPYKIRDIDIVATGMNEVPRRGGSHYRHLDSPDNRDQPLVAYNNDDRAQKIKISALVELIEKIKNKRWLENSVSDSEAEFLAKQLLPDLKRTQFMDIGEFMRPVHAEMSALIDSARRGVAVKDLSMYVTSFPCHNCAKHIIAAGIRRVVYLEPYPKSRAEFLHEEEINLHAVNGFEQDDRVAFLVFSGVAPRQYQQLFSMSRRSKKCGGRNLKEWESTKVSLSPLYVMENASAAYLLAERQALEKLRSDVYKWDKEAVCPAP